MEALQVVCEVNSGPKTDRVSAEIGFDGLIAAASGASWEY